MKKVMPFFIIIILLIVTFLYSIQAGSLDASLIDLFNGFFIEYNEVVASIYQIRFPRIFIAMLAGCGLAISGVLLQVSLKNKLADPSIIGISSGANLAAMCIITFMPTFYFYKTIFAFIGGIITFIIIYLICQKDKNPIKLILVGVALNMIMQALNELLSLFQGGLGVSVSTGVTMKTFDDVTMLFIVVIIGVLLSLVLSKRCNLMLLDDALIQNLGINVVRNRMLISIVAVFLASSISAVVGVVSFIGLLVPHLARMIIGNDHRYLIPFSGLFGSFLFLLSDTIGRLIILPLEIPVSIIISIVGGPIFIFLIRKVDHYG